MLSKESRGGVAIGGLMLVATPIVDLLLTAQALQAVHLATFVLGAALLALYAIAPARR
jgi:hypothetical protein